MAKTPTASKFSLAIEYCREEDCRWLTDIPALPGVTAYGRKKQRDTAAVQVLALRLIADRLGHGETDSRQPPRSLPEPSGFREGTSGGARHAWHRHQSRSGKQP